MPPGGRCAKARTAKYVGLAMPRFLGRLPYGVEDRSGRGIRLRGRHRQAPTPSKYGWVNAAYGMAVNITRSFKQYGWCSQHPRRGIAAARWRTCPAHTFPTDDGGVDMKCPTEIAIGDRREAELAKNGMMPLIHRKNTDMAAFIGAQSLHKPAEYDDPDATANANLAARLPYLFATCRFAHYLKCMVRDKVGSFKSRDGHAALAAGLDQQLRRLQRRNFVARRPRRASRWPQPKSWSRRSRATPATTPRSSSCVRITSWKVSRSRCGWCPSCRPKRPDRVRAVSDRSESQPPSPTHI